MKKEKGLNKVSKNIFLSVIIPVYNEEENLKKGVLAVVGNYLKNQKYSFEVIIVDDGSKDGSVTLIEKFIKDKPEFKLIKNYHGGKAIAVMTGMLQSKGEYALFTDMDQATPIEEVEKILSKLKTGVEIVIGSRKGRKGAPVIRKVMAYMFSTLRNLILGLPFKDTQCGFKAFNRRAIDLIFTNLLSRWEKMKAKGAAVNAGFDVETLFLAKKRGLKVIEVQVTWQYVGTERVQLINDGLEAIKDMLRIRFNDLLGRYG